MNKVYCKKDEQYISQELLDLWSDNFILGAYHMVSSSIYHHISDYSYYNQGGPPPPKREDILCTIHYDKNTVIYYLRGVAFFSLKDYLCALKNIAFL